MEIFNVRINIWLTIVITEIMMYFVFQSAFVNDIFRLKRQVRGWTIFFIIALLLSGITAFPIESELRWICSWWPEHDSTFYRWLNYCSLAITNTNSQYPMLAYGYDWLAFAHIVIAIAFIGVWRDPVRNKWVIEFGIISCLLITPLAWIAGGIRHIPLYWRMIDCSFGLFGAWFR